MPRSFICKLNTGYTQASSRQRAYESNSDMTWFNAFLSNFNGRVYFNQLSKPPPPITNLYVDACLTDMGGSLGRLVYALPLQIIPNLPAHCNIVHLEMINVFMALNLWKKDLKGRTVVIYVVTTWL